MGDHWTKEEREIIVEKIGIISYYSVRNRIVLVGEDISQLNRQRLRDKWGCG